MGVDIGVDVGVGVGVGVEQLFVVAPVGAPIEHKAPVGSELWVDTDSKLLP